MLYFNSKTPVATSAFSAQILVLTLFSKRKEPGPLREMADSKARIGKAQEVPGESHATKEERGKRVKRLQKGA